MKSIIIYGSKYGTTKKYAEQLAQLTDIEAVSYKKAAHISGYDRIIFLGGLYAGGVMGLKHTIKSLAPGTAFILVTVGLADVENSENIEQIKKSLKKQMPDSLYRSAKFFHLRGGIDYTKLSLKHKVMMSLLYKSVKKTPVEERTAEANELVETYKRKVDFVNYCTLDPLLQIIKES